jgi:hypothetical protein
MDSDPDSHSETHVKDDPHTLSLQSHFHSMPLHEHTCIIEGWTLDIRVIQSREFNHDSNQNSNKIRFRIQMRLASAFSRSFKLRHVVPSRLIRVNVTVSFVLLLPMAPSEKDILKAKLVIAQSSKKKPKPKLKTPTKGKENVPIKTKRKSVSVQ